MENGSPHPQMGIGGWGIYAMVIIFILATIAAIALIVDCLRRPRYHFGKLGPTPYVIVPGLYLVSLIFAVVMRVTGIGATISGPFTLFVGAMVLLMLVCCIAYGLDVLFPNEEARAKRVAYEKEHGITPKVKEKHVPKSAEELKERPEDTFEAFGSDDSDDQVNGRK